MQRLAMDLRMLSRELSLYLEHQVRVGFFGSGVGLSLILGFSVAYACYYLSSIAKKPQLVTGGESFSRFLQDHCPVVTETYYPTVWCWESRGQTLLRPFITSKPPVQYRNELIKTADGGQISLDWFDNDNSTRYMDASTRPTILLLPGLTGTSKESYILHMIHLSEELGYRCVVFNNRGVAGENLLTPRTYCCANTEDLETVIHHVHSLYPSAPFLAAGVSMGGMLLLNRRIHPTIGPRPGGCGITEHIEPHTCAAPKPFLPCCTVTEYRDLIDKDMRSQPGPLRSIFIARDLMIPMADKYSPRTLTNLRALTAPVLRKNVNTLCPERRWLTPFDFCLLDMMKRYAFPNKNLMIIFFSLLLLSYCHPVWAEAIPIETAKQNPNVALVLTSYGGHIGFLEGIWPRQSTYMDRVFKQFVQAMVEHGHELS
ncbi:PREDICTED: phospholipase ABHD3 [Cercocebus atys]|uniref:phospholipase ABHD3 n=1 Tax=Cercocebus atys TaxID=9531 RepID=UPI0005F3EEFF|nr:PREDICTED: phospholipase ABHD3 [Cercocebus atys]